MSRKRVLILGGGHAGVRCARELIAHRRARDEIDITIVSRENVEVWHGLMPQIVSGVLQAQHVLIPLREILPGVTIYTREIESIDPVKRQVVLSLGGESDEVALDADYMVIALGSVTDLSRFPGLTEHALQTKTIGDFIHLRNHLIEMLEAASVTTDAAERQRRLTFVVAGAGYAGVEIASEANEFLRASLRAYPMIAASELRVVTVDILNRVLPTFNDQLAQRVVDRMRHRGIELRLGVGIKEATAGAVVLADSASGPIPWSAGCRSSCSVVGFPVIRSAASLVGRASTRSGTTPPFPMPRVGSPTGQWSWWPLAKAVRPRTTSLPKSVASLQRPAIRRALGRWPCSAGATGSPRSAASHSTAGRPHWFRAPCSSPSCPPGGAVSGWRCTGWEAP